MGAAPAAATDDVMRPQQRAPVRRPGAQRAFDLWVTWRSCGETDRGLSVTSALKYEAIWRQWLRFLAARKRPWHAAAGTDVLDFVAGLQPRASARGIAQPSHVSRARYLRTLRAVYAHALLQGWIDANPAETAPAGARSEAADSFVLHAGQRRTLREHLPEGEDWLAVRDRALLCLLLEAALTVAELRTLRLDQLRLRAGPRGEADLRAELWLDGPRAAQRRELTLPAHAAAALRRWLVLRGAAGAGAPVFVSRKGQAMLTARAVFHVASRFVMQALRACGEQGAIAHVGPNVLRNTALVQWLDAGIDAGEVARRAGMDSSRTLLRLAPHCSETGRRALAGPAPAAAPAATAVRPGETA